MNNEQIKDLLKEGYILHHCHFKMIENNMVLGTTLIFGEERKMSFNDFIKDYGQHLKEEFNQKTIVGNIDYLL